MLAWMSSTAERLLAAPVTRSPERLGPMFLPLVTTELMVAPAVLAWKSALFTVPLMSSSFVPVSLKVLPLLPPSRVIRWPDGDVAAGAGRLPLPLRTKS